MSTYLIPITGRLIDPLGSGISGAAVWFTSKATSRGPENVPQTSDAAFITDPYGYYSTAIASGWYKILIQEPSALDPVKIGVATVSGLDTLDLGSLIDNSIPPPTLLENISNVSRAGLSNGHVLAYNTATRSWVPTVMTAGTGVAGTGDVSSSQLTATGVTLGAKIDSVSGWAASASNLTTSGVNLGGRIDSVGTNLTNTGVTLGAKVDSVSGWAASNLTATGATLIARDSMISGVLSDRLTSTGTALIARDLAISGVLAGQIVAAATGVTQSQLDAVSGFFLTPPQCNLAGGTGLILNRAYYDGFMGARTLGFIGAIVPGSWATLRANVSGNTALTIPTSYRIADSVSLSSLNLTPGNHELSWVYADGKWWLADSSSDGTPPTVSGLNGLTGAVSIVGTAGVVVSTAGQVVTVSGSLSGYVDATFATKAQVTSLSGYAAPLNLSINPQTGNYTLQLTDNGQYIRISGASGASPFVVTVPTNASVAFPLGCQIPIIQVWSGQFTVSGAAGVTVSNPLSLSATSKERGAVVGLIKFGTNEWDLMGHLQ